MKKYPIEDMPQLVFDPEFGSDDSFASNLCNADTTRTPVTILTLSYLLPAYVICEKLSDQYLSRPCKEVRSMAPKDKSLWNLSKRIGWRLIPWDSWLHRVIRLQRRKKHYETWIATGRQGNPPDYFRELVIRDYSSKFGLRIFVETGTFLGDMLAALENTFDILYSIELSGEFYMAAKRRFANKEKIRLFQGDSAATLPLILEELKQPALFWLDAHDIPDLASWVHLPVARGTKVTPVIDELQKILSHDIKTHVILVDNATMFSGRNDWPPLREIEQLALRAGRPYKVSDDIIRILGI